jgi:hypothetical protein
MGIGRRQRHSDLVHLSDDELERLARSLPPSERGRYVEELKFRGRRNVQRRKGKRYGSR